MSRTLFFISLVATLWVATESLLQLWKPPSSGMLLKHGKTTGPSQWKRIASVQHAQATLINDRVSSEESSAREITLIDDESGFPSSSMENGAGSTQVSATQLISRAVVVGSNLISAGISAVPLLMKTGDEGRRAAAAAALPARVAALGPSFVKVGQTLATRPDIVGGEVAAALEALQDRIPFFPTSEAREAIERELGAPVEALFDDFPPEPVAAASLGQVYKARLAGGGPWVAVKVQRPGLRGALEADAQLAYGATRAVAALGRALGQDLRTNLTQGAEEYTGRIYEELDYLNEAQNMIKFKQMYGDNPGIVIPEVYTNLSTSTVIVTEWLDGEKLVGEGAVRSEDVELIQLAIRCTLEQLLVKGFLHADPHGGNLLRTPDGRLGYLDFGLVSTIPPGVMDALVTTTIHFVNRDWAAVAASTPGLMLMSEKDAQKDGPALAVALAETFEPLFEEAAREGRPFPQLNFTKLIDKALAILKSFNLVVPPYFLNNVRALAELEGMLLSADPSLNMLGTIYPVVCRRLLTAETPGLRSALRSTLLLSGPEEETGAPAAVAAVAARPNWAALANLLRALDGGSPLLQRMPGTPSPRPLPSSLRERAAAMASATKTMEEEDARYVLDFATSRRGKELLGEVVDTFTQTAFSSGRVVSLRQLAKYMLIRKQKLLAILASTKDRIWVPATIKQKINIVKIICRDVWLLGVQYAKVKVPILAKYNNNN